VSPPATRGLVTAVVASYNHSRFLTRRMDSLLAQTYPHLEIIVIDDCSPDDSVTVLRRYANARNVQLIERERNSGWVAVSNDGVGLAKGEYVIFANCDDACDPRMIERLVDALERAPSADIAFCRSRMVDADDRVLGDDLEYQHPAFRARCVTDTLIPARKMGRHLLYGCVISNLSAALFRRSTFERVGLLTSEYRACSDWDLFFRIARVADVAYLAEPLNQFRQHATTIRSRMKERETYQEYFRLLFAEARHLDLSRAERRQFRTHAMRLWSGHLIAPSLRGLANFPYHLRLILGLDPRALSWLPWAMLLRVLELVRKVWQRVFGAPRTAITPHDVQSSR
jgi:glycosyltransferase involved in cell wall biosynthesis